MTAVAGRSAVVLVGGHESAGGRALRGLPLPDVTVVRDGRELYRAVAGLRDRADVVHVVPMTLGRDAGLVADAARTLLALPPRPAAPGGLSAHGPRVAGSAPRPAPVLLARPFGTAQHLVGWLRAAANRVPAEEALLVTAPAGDPFDDAELYRIARLVRQYGRHRTVEVALTGGDPGPAEGVERCRRLGAGHVTVLPAAFTVPDLPSGPVASTGPLLSPAAVAGVVGARVREAGARWDEHGDDGVAAGLSAAHDHGHNHSHAPGEGHDHHDDHGQGHGHAHPRGPAPGRAHAPAHTPAAGHGPGHGGGRDHHRSHEQPRGRQPDHRAPEPQPARAQRARPPGPPVPQVPVPQALPAPVSRSTP